MRILIVVLVMLAVVALGIWGVSRVVANMLPPSPFGLLGKQDPLKTILPNGKLPSIGLPPASLCKTPGTPGTPGTGAPPIAACTGGKPGVPPPGIRLPIGGTPGTPPAGAPPFAPPGGKGPGSGPPPGFGPPAHSTR